MPQAVYSLLYIVSINLLLIRLLQIQIQVINVVFVETKKQKIGIILPEIYHSNWYLIYTMSQIKIKYNLFERIQSQRVNNIPLTTTNFVKFYRRDTQWMFCS